MSELRYVPTREVAADIRKVLKQRFPGQKFSVRSDNYAGGSSIRVAWKDGPTSAEVNEVTKPYEYASFDGMIDLKSYRDSVTLSTGEKVRGGADFVFAERNGYLNG